MSSVTDVVVVFGLPASDAHYDVIVERLAADTGLALHRCDHLTSGKAFQAMCAIGALNHVPPRTVVRKLREWPGWAEHDVEFAQVLLQDEQFTGFVPEQVYADGWMPTPSMADDYWRNAADLRDP